MGCFGFDVFLFDSATSSGEKHSKRIEVGKIVVDSKHKKLESGKYINFLNDKDVDFADWSHHHPANAVFINSDMEEDDNID